MNDAVEEAYQTALASKPQTIEELRSLAMSMATAVAEDLDDTTTEAYLLGVKFGKER